MPHYKDGTEAAVGDHVKGFGYNLKNPDGSPKLFAGVVVGLTPGSESCNIQVAHVACGPLPDHVPPSGPFYRVFQQAGVIGCGANGGKDAPAGRVGAWVEMEYGECKSFEKIG